jgi:SSS family solute:Na+ symporter
MHWIDWCITILPVVFVLGMAVYSRRYVRGVADFLAAGRVAGRYVITVGDLESALSIATLVAVAESQYQAGYALGFWGYLIAPLSLILALTGYCVYRFRETKALSMGQFLEMRYNRPLRICAATVRSVADILGNAVAPIVTANFFVYFLGLPFTISIYGFQVPTFSIIVAIVLVMAVLVIWMGGRISLLITDFLQGMMSLPIFVIFTIYFLVSYSWTHEVGPVLLNRVAGESYLNPFDVSRLRDFNIFVLVVNVVHTILNRASWVGNDTSGCARTPHEQKMAGILGAWRGSFTMLVGILFAVIAITVMQNPKHSAEARDIRVTLADKISSAPTMHPEHHEKLVHRMKAIPPLKYEIGVNEPLSQEKNMDTPYFEVAHDTYGHDSEGNYTFQKFRTMFKQMRMPVVMRKTLPIGLLGLFCLLMIMLMLSTDDSRLMNCSSTIIQDIVMPLKKKAMTPEEHLLWLRFSALGVALVFFGFSLFFVQLDYVQMIMTGMYAIWLGGAGPIMIFGLYSKFGNTAGAFSSLCVGSGIPISGLILKHNWAKHVYPFIEKMGWTNGLDHFLRTVTSPFDPYVVWEMNPVKFPINSYEIFFLAMIGGLIAYILGSLLTYKKPYNLERMLHRGKYNIDGDEKIKSPWTWKNFYSKLIGITPEYTFGDKIIAYMVFGYSVVFITIVCFLGVLIWNNISPWPNEWWSRYWFVVRIAVPAVLGTGTAIWFAIGGIRDARRLFKDLAGRVDNPLDDGRVEGHVSLMDKALLGSDDDNGNGKKKN